MTGVSVRRIGRTVFAGGSNSLYDIDANFQVIAVACDNHVLIFDWESGQLTSSFELEENVRFSKTVRLSPTGLFVAVRSEKSRGAALYSLTGEFTGTIGKQDSTLLSFLRSGEIVSSSDHKSIEVLSSGGNAVVAKIETKISAGYMSHAVFCTVGDVLFCFAGHPSLLTVFV